ncbi:MAG TPA: hypothetical protein VGN60_07495 [Devosia sp.]|jgi:hypothetical protein|nr:hypothetical protein [Devosia sp.]
MNLPTWYDTGTASVANGSTSVTGAGTLWGDDAIMPGDLFCDLAQPLVPPQRIASVQANGELTLAAAWPGTALADAAYEIRYVGIIERSTAQTRRVLEQLGDITAWADIMVEDDAARLALETTGNPLRANFRVLVKDDGVIWAKASSAYDDWIGPVEFKGDTGDTGPIGPRGVTPKGDYSGATAYVEGDAVLYNGSSWVALGATTGNAPPVLPTTSNAYWGLLARQGTDGTGTGDVVGPASSVAGRLAGFDGTTGKLLKQMVPLDARLSAEAFGDYQINGLKPDKMSTNVLRLYPGVVFGPDGQLVARTTAYYDIDMAAVGVGGIDAGAPVDGVGYHVYVLRRASDGAFGAVISNSITYSGVALPAGYMHVRKLRFGFVYNSLWDGIPNHDAANWPWPYVRLTDSGELNPWRVLNAGTAASYFNFNTLSVVPDNARLVHLMTRIDPSGSPGQAYLRSPGTLNDLPVGACAASGIRAYNFPTIRCNSTGDIAYFCTGGVSLSVWVLGYYMTEPS